MKRFISFFTLERGAYFLLALFVLLLPIQTRLILLRRTLAGGFWEYGSVSLFISDVVLVMFLVAVGILVSKKQRAFNPSPRWITVPLVLLPVLSLISVIWASDRIAALWATYRLFLGVLLYVGVATLRPRFSFLVMWLVISAYLQAFIGLFQFLNQSSLGLRLLGESPLAAGEPGVAIAKGVGEYFLRAYGILPHPNVLAGFLLVALLLATVYLGPKVFATFRDKRFAIGLPFIVMVIFTGLFFTFSRSAWLTGFLIFLLFFLWLWFRKRELVKQYQLIFVLLAMSALLFAVIFRDVVAVRVDPSGYHVTDRSLVDRVMLTERALALVRESNYRGVGAGNFTNATFARIDSSLPPWEYQPAHNVPLLILAELGVTGFVIWIVCMLGLVVVMVKRLLSRLSPPSLEFAAVSFALLVLLFLSLFDHYLWTLKAGQGLFFLILALWIVNLDRRAPNSELRPS
ncbi:MAG: O-antigen ligase family protein [Parcubacteria group bacterium]|nr:O-antigen ligase family protein [Parcubacteria group bacterium]